MSFDSDRLFPAIRRRYVKVEASSIAPANSTPRNSVPAQSAPPQFVPPSELIVLVINSSQEMAKEITMQLTLEMPGCLITYAPTIAIAQWILARKRIDLIVSSPLLPDGGIGRLQGALAKLSSPPDLVVVGNPMPGGADAFGDANYHLAELRRFGAPPPETKKILPQIVRRTVTTEKKIQSLGADLRNDLNNPLQEIVAMIFVAQSGGELNPGTHHALNAIEGAAKNMARVVGDIEEKIRGVVGT